MISLFFSHNQTLEPMSQVGMAETSTDKRLTAFASLAALWVETWQGQVKTVRVRVHITLYDSMALKKRKSRAWEGRLSGLCLRLTPAGSHRPSVEGGVLQGLHLSHQSHFLQHDASRFTFFPLFFFFPSPPTELTWK